jgi:ribonucleotide reductase alpha subunit
VLFAYAVLFASKKVRLHHVGVRVLARQRHIDQAQSMNLYITNDYTLRQVLGLCIDVWRHGVKTIYYVRSRSLEVEECESCSA